METSRVVIGHVRGACVLLWDCFSSPLVNWSIYKIRFFSYFAGCRCVNYEGSERIEWMIGELNITKFLRRRSVSAERADVMVMMVIRGKVQTATCPDSLLFLSRFNLLIKRGLLFLLNGLHLDRYVHTGNVVDILTSKCVILFFSVPIYTFMSFISNSMQVMGLRLNILPV